MIKKGSNAVKGVGIGEKSFPGQGKIAGDVRAQVLTVRELFGKVFRYIVGRMVVRAQGKDKLFFGALLKVVKNKIIEIFVINAPGMKTVLLAGLVHGIINIYFAKHILVTLFPNK